MSTRLRSLLCWLPALFLGACQHVVPSAAGGPAVSTLVVLHTNDMHANYLPGPATWLPGEPEIGGMMWLDAYVARERAALGPEHVLLLDAGDLLTGTPLSDLRVDGVRGAAMPAFLGAIGYDAWTLGNHEFDRGWQDVLALVESSPVPVLCANLQSSVPDDPLVARLPPSMVIQRAGLDIAVIGLISEDLLRVTLPGVTGPLSARSAIEATREQMALLESDTDLQIVLSHLGDDADRVLARAVPGVDLIVGGHSHKPLSPAVQVGETWIVQARPETRGLGRVVLTVADGHVVGVDSRILDLVPQDGLHASAVVEEQVSHWQTVIDSEFSHVLGPAPLGLTRQGVGGTSLGGWITEVLRVATGADVAVYNAGGLRADLPAGDVTRLDLFQVFPFGNMAVTLELDGRDLLALVESNVHHEQVKAGSGYQMAGVEVHWRTGQPPALISVQVGGAALDPARTYRVATNSYLAGQWETHLPGVPRGMTSQGFTVREAGERAVERGELTAPAPGFIREP